MEENEKLNKFLNFFKHFDILPEEQELGDEEVLVILEHLILIQYLKNVDVSGKPRLFKR